MEILYQICCGGFTEDPAIPINSRASAHAIDEKSVNVNIFVKFYKIPFWLHTCSVRWII